MTRLRIKGFTSFSMASALLLAGSLLVNGQNGLTVDQAIKIAETNSPTMKQTRLSLVRSQENLNAQNAALKSNFSLTLNPIGYNQTRDFNELISDWNSVKTTESYGLFTISQPVVWTDARVSITNRFGYRNSFSEYANTTTKGFTNNLSISLDQPLFTYNRVKLQLKELQLALENAQLNYAIQLLNIEKQVTQAFYYVYQQQQSLDIANQAYDNMMFPGIKSMQAWQHAKKFTRPNLILHQPSLISKMHRSLLRMQRMISNSLSE
jgi:outer membrane protein